MFSSAAFVVLVFATSQAKEWEKYEYPNPRLNPDKCGHDRVSYICDPDKYLSNDHANLLDKEIELVMNYTSCPCASYTCDKGARGYKIGVAVVDKIKPKESKRDADSGKNLVDKNLDKSLDFSYYLLSEWNLGECDEDLIILYSVKDHVVYTTTNEVTRKKLHNNLVGEISMAHRMELQGGNYYEGLKSMILDYKRVLMGDYKRKTSSPSGPQYAAMIGSQSAFLLPCFSTVLLVALVSCLLH